MPARVLFPVLTWRGNAITPPAPGDHKGPPFPTSSALAPTESPGLLSSFQAEVDASWVQRVAPACD
jgi:hypothetical protein